MNNLEYKIVEEAVFALKFEIEKLVIGGMLFEQAKKEAVRNHLFVSLEQTLKREIVSVVNDMVPADLQPAAKDVIDNLIYTESLRENGSKDTWWRKWIFVKTSIMV